MHVSTQGGTSAILYELVALLFICTWHAVHTYYMESQDKSAQDCNVMCCALQIYN